VRDYVNKNTKNNDRNELKLERNLFHDVVNLLVVEVKLTLLLDMRKLMQNGKHANKSVKQNGLSKKKIDELVKLLLNKQEQKREPLKKQKELLVKPVKTKLKKKQNSLLLRLWFLRKH